MQHYESQSHTIQTHVETNHGYYLEQSASTTLLQKDKVVDLTSKNSVQSGALQSSNSNYITFDLNGFEGDYVEELTIKLTVTNTSLVVGTTTLVPAPLLIDRVEIFYDTTQLETILGEAIWTDLLAYDSDEVLSRISNVNGFDPDTFLTNNTFNEGDSKTYYIPIRSIITGSGIPFCCEDSNKFKMRIFLRGGNNIIETGFPVTALITDFVVNDLSLVMIINILDPKVRKLTQKQLKARPFDYRFMEHRWFTIQSGDITGGTQYNENFQQMGDLSHMFLFLRPAGGGVGEEIYSPRSLDSLDFIDSGGMSLLSTSRDTVTSDLLRYIMTPHYFPSRLFDELTIYPLTWNTAPAKSMLTQAKYGSLYLTSNQRLLYTPTVTETDTEILVIAYFYSMLTIDHLTGQHLPHLSS